MLFAFDYRANRKDLLPCRSCLGADIVHANSRIGRWNYSLVFYNEVRKKNGGCVFNR